MNADDAQKRPVTAIALLEADDVGVKDDGDVDAGDTGIEYGGDGIGGGAGDRSSSGNRRRRKRPATVAGNPGEMESKFNASKCIIAYVASRMLQFSKLHWRLFLVFLPCCLENS
mgnify:CR=1 FL=1